MWKYETKLVWNGGEAGTSEAAGRPSLSITPPAEFGGQEDRWNPELLLVSAIESCLLLTTLSVMQRQKIVLKSYRSEASGTMEKTPDGLRFTGMEVAISVTVSDAAEVEKAQRAVVTAEKYCPVSNAVKFPVKVTVSATTA